MDWQEQGADGNRGQAGTGDMQEPGQTRKREDKKSGRQEQGIGRNKGHARTGDKQEHAAVKNRDRQEQGQTRNGAARNKMQSGTCGSEEQGPDRNKGTGSPQLINVQRTFNCIFIVVFSNCIYLYSA